LWQWCDQRRILLFAIDINTKINHIADALSRSEIDEYDFMLGEKYFSTLCHKLCYPIIDLFAFCNTKQCERFVSWMPHPEAEWVDAFTIKWEDSFYAFPPFRLLSRVLSKIESEGCKGIVVAPSWPTQPWYPLFLKLAISKIYTFKPASDLLYCPYFNRPHHLSKQVSLMAALLSTNRSKD